MPKSPQLLSHTGLGAQSFTIDWNDFIKGASTSDKISNGGFSPNSYNINLLSALGEVSSTAAPTEYVGFGGHYYGFVATCPNVDIGGVSGKAVRGVTTKGDFYSITSLGAATTPVGDTTNSYASAFSDIVSFNGAYYASSHNAATGDNVCSWDGSTTIVVDWFHTHFSSNYLKLNAPHPMLVFNKNLYIADGNMLHKWDGASSYQYAQLTLDTDAVISALSIDPNSGRMMVAYSQVWQAAAYPTHSNIGLYDGTNPTQFVKIVPMDDIVRAMYSIGGSVFLSYGQTSLGIWNGSGVTFLRQLQSSLSPLQKQQTTNIGNDFYFYDSGYLWVYTEIIGLGKKVFNRVLKLTTGQNLMVLFNQDSVSKIGFSTIDGSNNYHLFQVDMGAVGAQSQLAIFYSNWYYFPRPVYIRAIDLTMEGLLTSSDTVTPSINDDQNNNSAFNPSNISSSNTVQTNRMSTDIGPTTSAQFVLTMQTSIPFKRAVVYYDPAE